MLKKISKITLLLALGLYMSASAYLYFNQKNLIFLPRALNQQLANGFEHLKIEFQHEGVALRGWMQQADATKPFVFYYGGNGEEVSKKLHLFPKLGIENFLLLNYRGYGLSEGSPNEKDLKQDALMAYDKIVQRLKLDTNKIIIFGNSLGTGLATYVASKRPAAKVVLNTPYDSIAKVGQGQYPLLPVYLLANQRFDSIDLAPKINIPMLCLIAEKDTVIPPKHASNLCGNWLGKTDTITIRGAGHNDILTFPETLSTIRNYLSE